MVKQQRCNFKSLTETFGCTQLKGNFDLFSWETQEETLEVQNVLLIIRYSFKWINCSLYMENNDPSLINGFNNCHCYPLEPSLHNSPMMNPSLSCQSYTFPTVHCDIISVISVMHGPARMSISAEDHLWSL